MRRHLSQEEKERAVTLLIAKTGAAGLKRLSDRIRQGGPIWNTETRRGLAIYVMNTLAGAGFDLELADYFDLGVELLEEAADRGAELQSAALNN